MKIISWLPAPLKKTFPYNYFVNTLEPTVNKKVGDVFHPEKIMNGTQLNEPYLEKHGIYVPPMQLLIDYYSKNPLEQGGMFNSLLMMNPFFLEKIKAGKAPLDDALATAKHEVTHFFQRRLLPIKTRITPTNKSREVKRLEDYIIAKRAAGAGDATDINALAYDFMRAPFSKGLKTNAPTKGELLAKMTPAERNRLGLEILKERHATTKERGFANRSMGYSQDTEHRYKLCNDALEVIGDFEKGWVMARGMLP